MTNAETNTAATVAEQRRVTAISWEVVASVDPVDSILANDKLVQAEIA